MRASTLGVVLGMAIAIAMACGPKRPPDAPQKRDEITALSMQIRDWRREAGLPVDPRPQDMPQTPKDVEQAKRVCPDSHPVPPSCSDVCSLADAICDNAEQICILADELGKDDKWAQDKCASAKVSCRDAKKKCCTKCSDDASKAPVTDEAPAK
jgi:hypothetical protein